MLTRLIKDQNIENKKIQQEYFATDFKPVPRLHHVGLVSPVIQITLVTIITTKKICFFQIAFQKTTIREK